MSRVLAFFPYAVIAAVGFSIWGWWLDAALKNANPVWGGQLGDSFGVINSLFSKFATVGVFWTILHQQRELRLAREQYLKSLREERFSSLIQRVQDAFSDIHVEHNGVSLRGLRAIEKAMDLQETINGDDSELYLRIFVQTYIWLVALNMAARYVLETADREQSDYLRSVLAINVNATQMGYIDFLPDNHPDHDLRPYLRNLRKNLELAPPT